MKQKIREDNLRAKIDVLAIIISSASLQVSDGKTDYIKLGKSIWSKFFSLLNPILQSYRQKTMITTSKEHQTSIPQELIYPNGNTRKRKVNADVSGVIGTTYD